jgi:hypothetical protein
MPVRVKAPPAAPAAQPEIDPQDDQQTLGQLSGLAHALGYDGPTLDEMPEYFKILYYGEPGSGKTSAACAMARLGPMYLVDAEAGAKARPLRKLGIPTKNIRPIHITGYKDLDDFYWRLKRELEEDPDAVVGVSFDSYTEIHQVLLNEQVMQRHGKAVRAASNSAGELMYEVEDSEFDVELKQHGIVTEQLRRITRRFRDLPCHVAFVTLAKKDLDGETGEVVYLPALPPKFGLNLRGYVDLVAYVRQVPGVNDSSGYIGVFRDTGKYRGKDRLGGTPVALADPAFDRVAACITETLDLDDDPVQQRYLDRGRAAKAALESQKSG